MVAERWRSEVDDLEERLAYAIAVLEEYRPSWHADAACHGDEWQAFFPVRGADVRPAKVVCVKCVVRYECLAFALEYGEKHGIRGGLSERERRQLRKMSQGSRTVDPWSGSAQSAEAC